MSGIFHRVSIRKYENKSIAQEKSKIVMRKEGYITYYNWENIF